MGSKQAKQKRNLVNQQIEGSPPVGSQRRNSASGQRRQSHSKEGHSSINQKQRNSDKKCDSLPKEIKYSDKSGNETTLKQEFTTYTCVFCNIKYKDTIVYKDKDIFRCLDCVKKGLSIDATDSSCLDIAIQIRRIFNTNNFQFNDDYVSECNSCNKEIVNQGIIYVKNEIKRIYCLMCVITSKDKIIESKGTYKYKSPGYWF
jgi:hypothetical protein